MEFNPGLTSEETMLEEKINKDYIEAMKAKDQLRSSTLNFLKSQMKYLLIEKKIASLPDLDVITVIKKQIKQRQESIEQYTQGGRQDLADKEAAEWAVLKTYLPEEISEDELKKIVETVIKETQANSIKDMGKVMKAVGEKVSGRADNKRVSEWVKKALSS